MPGLSTPSAEPLRSSWGKGWYDTWRTHQSAACATRLEPDPSRRDGQCASGYPHSFRNGAAAYGQCPRPPRTRQSAQPHAGAAGSQPSRRIERARSSSWEAEPSSPSSPCARAAARPAGGRSALKSRSISTNRPTMVTMVVSLYLAGQSRCPPIRSLHCSQFVEGRRWGPWAQEA